MGATQKLHHNLFRFNNYKRRYLRDSKGDVMKDTTGRVQHAKVKTMAVVLIGLVSISVMSQPVGAWMWHEKTVYLGSAYGGYFEMKIYKNFWGDEQEARFYFWNYPYSQTMVIPDGCFGKINITCDGTPSDRCKFIEEVVDVIRDASRAYSCAKAVITCGGGSTVCVTVGFLDGPLPAVDYVCFSYITYECASSIFECLA